MKQLASATVAAVVSALGLAVPNAAATEPYLRIDGATDQSHAGEVMAPAGDVNADGRQDILIAVENEGAERPGGSVYVVFGPSQPGVVDLANLGEQGYRIEGKTATRSVAAAGDVNGDGLDDVLVGSYRGGGRVYVVFGKRDSATVDLGALGRGGYRVNGPTPRHEDAFGEVIAGIGDVNRDGVPDLAASKPGHAGEEGTGTIPYVYVIYGQRRSTATISTRRLTPKQGFRVRIFAESVAGIGDMNGDGRADVAIGTPDFSRHAAADKYSDGTVTVVYGNRYRGTVAVYRWIGRRGEHRYVLGRRGVRVLGPRPAARAGASVAGPGDLNGDRIPDLALGAPANGLGETWVVFGRRSPGTIDLRRLGRAGFRVTGTPWLGTAVAAAGDVNGDGLADVLSTADDSLLAVFGKRTSGRVDVGALDGRGFTVLGPPLAPYRCGWPRGFTSVAGAGDLNGDGRADVLAGAPCAGARGESGSQSMIAAPGAVFAFLSP